MGPLVIDQPLLPPLAAAVPAQSAIRGNHAMTRDDNRDPVLTVGPPDRTHGGR